MSNHAINQSRVKKIITIFGVCLIQAPIGLHWYWGNLSTYVLSYIHQGSSPVSSAGASWVSSLFLTTQSIIFLVSDYVIPRLGLRTTTLMGIIGFNAGVFASFFAVEHSVITVNLALGAIAGSGSGLVYGAGTKYGIMWSNDKDIGIITALINSSYCIFAILVNQFVTFYINPSNKIPNFKYRDYIFFSQIDVLRRVPVVFLILGIAFSVIQIVGLLLSRNTPLLPSISHATGGEGEDMEKTSPTRMSTVAYKADVNSVSCFSEARNRSPKETIRTSAFYVIVMAFFMIEYSFLMVTVYYKAFGQLWINDDFFLMVLGVSFELAASIVKIFSGLFVDMFGCKAVLIFYISIITVMGASLYLAPQFNRWIYFLVAVVLTCLSGTCFLIFTLATMALFGRRDALGNIGLITLATVFMSIVAPPLMGFLLDKGGWASLFFSGSVLSFISLLLVVIGLPQI